MLKCWICGTCGIFASLVPALEKNGCLNFPPDYFECEDERECVRRSKMKMAPSLPWPGPAL